MPVCEWCGKEFDENEAADDFDMEMGILTYRNVQKCLCGDCAIKAITEMDEDVYFETCEKCGKVFDFILDSGKFGFVFGYSNNVELQDYWDPLILCADCALGQIPFNDGFQDDEEDEEEYNY